MRSTIFSLCVAPLIMLVACSTDEPTLQVTLVPNPEVNTREDVAAHVNALEIILDAQEGFAGLDHIDGDTWGPYDVADLDADGVLELRLPRPGSEFLEPFAFTQGSQGDRVITIIARGFGTTEDQLTALGGAASTFDPGTNGHDSEVEVPFNLVPEYRPLRVLSMTPSPGAQNIEPSNSISLQLGGEVLPTALEGRVTIEGAGNRDDLIITTSYIDSSMGLLTNVQIDQCALLCGAYTVTLATEICTTTGQCLDQHLAVDGDQPFEGLFTVRENPEAEVCGDITTETVACPDNPCPEEFECIEGVCVGAEIETPMGTNLCNETLCSPPAFVCVNDGECIPDCRLYGVCPSFTDRCNQMTGRCVPTSE